MVLKKAQTFHIIERIHKVTQVRDMVLVGSGALIATAKALPATLMMTEEIDVYARDATNPDDWEDKVQLHFGQDSPYDKMYKCYADPVSPNTAILPTDWNDRAVTIPIAGGNGLTVTCPSSNALAISKLCAWREKDKTWLIECAKMRLVDLAAMRSLSRGMIPPNGPGQAEIHRGIEVIEFEILPPGEKKARIAANDRKHGIAPSEKREGNSVGQSDSKTTNIPDLPEPSDSKSENRDQIQNASCDEDTSTKERRRLQRPSSPNSLGRRHPSRRNKA